MQEEQNQETTGEDQIDPNLAKALAQFLSGENYNRTIQAFIKHKTIEHKTERNHNIWQFAIVALILISIVFCGYFEILEGLSVGILISALLGYVLGSFRQE